MNRHILLAYLENGMFLKVKTCQWNIDILSLSFS